MHSLSVWKTTRKNYHAKTFELMWIDFSVPVTAATLGHVHKQLLHHTRPEESYIYILRPHWSTSLQLPAEAVPRTFCMVVSLLTYTSNSYTIQDIYILRPHWSTSLQLPAEAVPRTFCMLVSLLTYSWPHAACIFMSIERSASSEAEARGQHDNAFI